MKDTLSGSAFGNVGNYTLEEIEAAQKLKKKYFSGFRFFFT